MTEHNIKSMGRLMYYIVHVYVLVHFIDLIEYSSHYISDTDDYLPVPLGG